MGVFQLLESVYYMGIQWESMGTSYIILAWSTGEHMEDNSLQTKSSSMETP